jgi:hypothetical protein
MTTDMPEERCLSAYYYGFQHTKDDYIDAILEAVAMAGKSFHSTSEWTEENDFLDGLSYAQLIQNKADEASDKHEELKAIAEKMAVALGYILMSHDATCKGEDCGIFGIDFARDAITEYNKFKGVG